MPREYTVLDSGYIQYEENGFLITIPNDPSNADYQRYLNPEVEHLTEIITPNQLEEQANDQSL